ncbi:MAG: hypothetical protein JWP37_2050 [Mucilaginibacter sp.]|nr:hypothetical protein [Mucilaginibacter sp.]
MLKRLLLSTTFAAFFFLNAKAQTDTTHYDLGRILLKKEFTQGITIKGRDLERYQFSNLADAINVWLYGIYSNSSSLTYVVDGNLVTDVNAYSIYDIDEITLVQNALVQINGAGGQLQLVLIKTRRNKPGKQGIEAAGQTSMVNVRDISNQPGAKSTVDLYHQYYLSAYKNYNNIQFGASADYQRDVMPEITNSNYKVNDPLHYDRFKFNAYANINTWKGSILNFDVTYDPQRNKADNALNINQPPVSIFQYQNYYIIQHLVNSNISLKSHIVNGLNNIFSAGYSHYNYHETDNFSEGETTSPPINVNSFVVNYNTTSNLLLRDNLYYEKKVGNFVFEPSVNFTFRYLRDSLTTNINTLTISNLNIPEASNSKYASFAKFRTYFLTPSINLYYKKIFNLQGGFLYDLSKTNNQPPDNEKPPKLFPFISANANIAPLIDPNTTIAINLHGAYALSYEFGDGYSALDELGNPATTPVIINQFVSAITNPDGSLSQPSTAANNLYRSFKTLTAGIDIDLFKNKLTIGYLFEKRNYLTTVEEQISSTDNSFTETIAIAANTAYYLNTVNINFKAINTRSFKWQTGINTTSIKQKLPDFGISIGQNAWTGGFVNRFEVNNLFAGANLLYAIGERNYTATSMTKTNSFSLQNLYAGTKIKITHLKYAEVFASARNISQNKSSDITDNRRFYGLGFKLGL